MILLRRWQRYARYLGAAAFFAFLVSLICHTDLEKDVDYEEYYEYKFSGRRGLARLEKLSGHGKAGIGNDHQWLLMMKRHGLNKALPLVVVEDHYEVLQYWFQAADLGIIPKSKNILIHMDAHADLEIPVMTRSVPLFHYPTNQKEVRSLLQKDGRFIVAAVQSGLVDHIVWVMPSWMNELSIPVNVWYKFGTLMRRAPGDHKQNFCSCWIKAALDDDKNDISNSQWGDSWLSDDINNEWRCRANEFSPLEEEDNGSEINPAQCSIHMSGLLQVVSETSAHKVLASLKPTGMKNNLKAGILLDIGQDFFSCWSDAIDLERSGLNSDQTSALSGLLAEVFCADTAFDERVADMFYGALLNLLVNIKLQSCELRGESLDQGLRRRKCYSSLEMSNLLIEKIPRMIKFLNEVGETDHILCKRMSAGAASERSSPLAGQLQSLVVYLQNLNIEQLRLLAWLGICLDVSPLSAHFQSRHPLKLCQGQSANNYTTMPLYHPTDEGYLEPMLNFNNFSKLIAAMKRQPNLVTISRSVRDGFTPKDLFHIIELKLFDGLKSVYKHLLHGDSIHYDSNLLGGKLGWPRRFPSWNNKLLKYLSVEVVADHYQGM